jgi:UDP-glucose 4-epimerase
MRCFVVGGAGFIGSHLVRKVLPNAGKVTVYDNFSSGRKWHLEDIGPNASLRVVTANVRDLDALTRAMAGHDLVFHFASNPDIARAATEPDIDFWEGTYLTQNVLEAMRRTGVKQILYASGSGVYGDTGLLEVAENHAPMLPISTYGASKLGCEALLCAYCHMFGIVGRAFRFANVVGPRQTHGVAYDFIRRLKRDPCRLRILGDGRQSKSYVHVDDVLSAMLLVQSLGGEGFDAFNVATGDYLTVREIADLVVGRLGLVNVEYEFAGGDRGWKGDVPVVRFNTAKIRSLGWTNQRTSRQAMADAVEAMIADAQTGRLYLQHQSGPQTG